MKNFCDSIHATYQDGLVNKVRPKFLLKAVEELYNSPMSMDLYVPSSEIGSLTTLESTMLICMLKIFKPQIVFEYGTFLGYSTSLFLKNSTQNCRIISIDLGSNFTTNEIDVSKILADDKTNDDYLRIVQSKSGPFYIQNEIDTQNERLKLLYGDSRDLSVDSLGLTDKVNFVFIDGGHTYDIVSADTINAFQMVKNGIIVWHDYGSKIHGDVTKFIDRLSVNKKIYHIENTMLCFHIVESA